MTRNNLTLFLLILLLTLGSCRNSKSSLERDDAREGVVEAKLLSITHNKGYTKVEIINPWDTTKLLQTYLLVPRDSELPKDLPKGTVVRTPIQNVLVYSSVHSSLMHELGCFDVVKGVTDAQYFNDTDITSGISSGEITDCGSSMAPTIERVIEMEADAVWLSPYQDATYGQVAKLGVPIIECADYLETTPLGRAEWVRFYGELLGCPDKADSLYNAVRETYTSLKEQISSDRTFSRPKVLTEMVISGVWNVPGGHSYMARLIADAGGDYPWADNESTGSLSLDFNQVLAIAQDADVWLVKSFMVHSLKDLEGVFKLNTSFKAFGNRQVYVCDTNSSHLFDRFPFHPNVLLREYHNIFTGRDNELVFFERLEK